MGLVAVDEIDLAANMIRAEANPAANLIWGATFDETLEDEIKITVIATGFDANKKDADKQSDSVDADEDKKESSGDDMDILISLLGGNK